MQAVVSQKILVHIVTYNHSATILPCIRSVLDQQGFTAGKDLFVHVTDNVSADDTQALLRQEFADTITVHCNETNEGFTGAHNRGIHRGSEVTRR